MLDEILQALINMAMFTSPYSQIVIGSDPPINGICMVSTGSPRSTFRDMDTDWTLSVLLNGKNASQQAVSEALNAIHRFMTLRKDFPHGNGWQVYAITTQASPRLIGREQNNQWIYGSSLQVKFYAKGID